MLVSHSNAQQNRAKDSLDHHLLALENERLADSCINREVKAIYLLKEARHLKCLKQYKAAYATICAIETKGFSDSLSYQIRYEAALSALLSDNLEGLKINLLFLDQNKEAEKHPKEYGIMKVLYFNRVKDYVNAYQSALQCIELDKNGKEKKDSIKNELAKLFSRNLPQEMQPETFAIMASIIPGSSQIVMGYMGEGISSLMINFGLLSLGIYDIANGLYLTSFAVLLNLLPRFYIAGIKRARAIAQLKNEQRTQTFNQECLRLLMP